MYKVLSILVLLYLLLESKREHSEADAAMLPTEELRQTV